MDLASALGWIAQGAALLVFYTLAFNWVFKSLPGPLALPLIGNVHQLPVKKVHSILEKWADKYGDLYEFWLLNRRIVVTSRASMIKEVLRQRPHNFSRHQPLNDAIVSLFHGSGLFNAEGKEWERQRRLTAPSFSRKAVEESYAKVCSVSLEILARWDRLLKTRPYTEVDMSKAADGFTAEVLYEIALFGGGVDGGASRSGLIKDVQTILMGIGRRSFAGVPVYKWYKNKQEAECEQASERVRSYIYQMVEGVRSSSKNGQQAEKQGKDGDVPNLLAKLVHAKESRSDDRNALSSQEVFANTMTILLAGADTTSTTLSWTVYLLLKNPSVLKKAQQEVDALLAVDDVPTYEQLGQLKYLNAIVKESLRLKATGTFLALQCNDSSTVIDGFRFKRGEALFALIRHTAMKNGGGQKFDPDRWLQDDPPCGPSYFAFGYGPRVCPGKELAKIEASLFLALLIRRYHITYPLGQSLDNPEIFMLVMKPENPVMIRIAPRA